jgi:hypothetical protein
MPQVTEVQSALAGVDYPAQRDDLVEHARRQRASEDVVEALQSTDAEQFDGPDDVMRALKGRLGGDGSRK